MDHFTTGYKHILKITQDCDGDNSVCVCEILKRISKGLLLKAIINVTVKDSTVMYIIEGAAHVSFMIL